ncbi:hypothetical protein BaRGS_00023290 [Batillaria attramentaria]|uniref:Uncharacterized protein n=1 Tax=Batillaria attramentaria TaxID=370345 RepID=A0ABD0JV03_9CAEN
MLKRQTGKSTALALASLSGVQRMARIDSLEKRLIEEMRNKLAYAFLSTLVGAQVGEEKGSNYVMLTEKLSPYR